MACSPGQCNSEHVVAVQGEDFFIKLHFLFFLCFRTNEHFRMMCLFQNKHVSFINTFRERHPKMLQFLCQVEACAVQLDQMNMGAKISSVVGSSVGAVGGVLSIIGLALTPVTFGTSMALTLTGVGMGVTSGVNTIVTTATEIGVNRTQKNKASEAFDNFMKDVNVVQECLDKITHEYIDNLQDNLVVGGLKVDGKAAVVAKGIDSLVDCISALKVLQTEKMVATAGKVAATEGKALGSVSKVASDLPEMSQAALQGPLAMSTVARGGLIAVNVLFIGMDVFFIVKDSFCLYKGSETQISKYLRARAALWSSVIDSWQKICDSLERGQQYVEQNQNLLRILFYPDIQ